MKSLVLFATLAALAFSSAWAQDTNFASIVECDLQEPEKGLRDLTLLQGSAPMFQVRPMIGTARIPADSLTTVQFIISQTATGSYFVATNSYLATNSAYWIQLGTIGTNSCPTNSATPAPWFYTILFSRNGGVYWSGNGKAYIEAATFTGTNGLVWQAWAAGAAKDDLAREWINDLSNEVAAIEAGEVVYGTATNNAYRGVWGASVSNLAAQAAGWGDHAAAGYATGTPVYAETDPIFSATNAWLVRTNDATYTATVAKAASAVQPGDTNGWVVSSHSGLATEAQAGQIATNVASGYLPLAGHNGPVVLGTRTRGYAASTNLGNYGFAAGDGTSAGYAGFAAGEVTTAGEYGFAAGLETTAGYAGFAAGADTSAGETGFAAGTAARGADGSFVFADNSAGGAPFNRTNILNSFGLRVAGGIYAEIGTNVFAVSNAVTMNGVELGAGGGSGWTNATLLTLGGTNVTTAALDPATFSMSNGTLSVIGGGSTSTTSGASASAESLPQPIYGYSTNIVLLAGTNSTRQMISAITGPMTITAPTLTSTNDAADFWLIVPAVGTNAAGIVTNGTIGYVPTLSTGSVSCLYFYVYPGAGGWRVRRTQ